MKKSKTVVAVALAGVSFFVLITLASCGGPRHSHASPETKINFAVSYLSAELDFTDEQKEEFKAIVSESVYHLKSMSDDHESVRHEMAELVRNNEISAESIDRMIDRRIDKINEMRPFIKEKVIAINDILTDEQRAKVADHIESGEGGPFRH